jgi:exodeoxyribonuclease-5
MIYLNDATPGTSLEQEAAGGRSAQHSTTEGRGSHDSGRATVTTSSLQLTPEQERAVRRVMDWWSTTPHRSTEHQVFRLFGPAGTGKTTLAKYIAAQVREATIKFGDGFGDVVFAAYTGKAAHVLRRKGCEGARTLHSLIYVPTTGCDFSRDGASIDAEHTHTPDCTRVRFVLREPDDCELTDAALLIVDECSMVGPALADDLLSFGCPVLVLGDPAQLPPVGGEGALTNTAPDVLLEEIHRQALDNPVLELATRVRLYGASEAAAHKRQLDASWLLRADQVLVGRNATRWQAVEWIRAQQGFPPGYPVPGDRIMVLTNNGGLSVFNGQQFAVIELLQQHGRHLVLRVLDEDGMPRTLPVDTAGFLGLAAELEAKKRRAGYSDVAFATFAQAITVHKSQGSEWGNVLVMDESYIFNGTRRGEPDHSGRWLYTAITRASNGVGIVTA